MAQIRGAYIVCTHCRTRFYPGIGFYPGETARAATERLAGIVFTCPHCRHKAFCDSRHIAFVEAHGGATTDTRRLVEGRSLEMIAAQMMVMQAAIAATLAAATNKQEVLACFDLLSEAMLANVLAEDLSEDMLAAIQNNTRDIRAILTAQPEPTTTASGSD